MTRIAKTPFGLVPESTSYLQPSNSDLGLSGQSGGQKGGIEMEWQFIVALVVAIPIILFPVAFVWYLNIGGIYVAIREAREKRKAAHEEGIRAVAEEHPAVTTGTVAEERPVERELVGARH